MNRSRSLAGRAVLVVEDNFLIGLEMAGRLQELGLRVVGPCATVEQARAALEHDQPDLAVLDVRLGHGSSMEFASELVERGVACAFVTGYSSIPELPEQLHHLPKLSKPIDPLELRTTLEQLAMRLSARD